MTVNSVNTRKRRSSNRCKRSKACNVTVKKHVPVPEEETVKPSIKEEEVEAEIVIPPKEEKVAKDGKCKKK